jgi:hypothetical protein
MGGSGYREIAGRGKCNISREMWEGSIHGTSFHCLNIANSATWKAESYKYQNYKVKWHRFVISDMSWIILKSPYSVLFILADFPYLKKKQKEADEITLLPVCPPNVAR